MQSSLFVNTPWLQRHSPYIKHNRDYNVVFAATPDSENHSDRIHKASPSSQTPWRCSVARGGFPTVAILASASLTSSINLGTVVRGRPVQAGRCSL